MSSPAAAPRLHDLAPLVAPVYAPTVLYAAGAAALVPAQVLLALQLGFDAGQVAAVLTWIGAFSIFSSWAAGGIVDRFGEGRSVAAVTLAGAAGLVLAAACAVAGLPGARWVLVTALTLFDLVDAVWAIARQGMVADLAPPHARGLAMNLYGAGQRLGRVIGPGIAAAVLLVTGPAAVLPVAGVVTVAAMAWLVRRMPASAHQEAVPSSQDEPEPAGHSRLRAMLLLGAGVLVLAGLRTAKETLVPLWADQGVHLPAAQVALVMSLASSTELLLFWPAGRALDRYGRAPVVVTAMTLMALGLCLAPGSSATTWLLVCVALIGLGDGAGAGIIKVLGVDLAPAAGRSRFFGRWQAIASAGALLAPVVATLVISLASLRAALLAIGLVGLAGAAWMAWWTPRIVPNPRRATGNAVAAPGAPPPR